MAMATCDTSGLVGAIEPGKTAPGDGSGAGSGGGVGCAGADVAGAPPGTGNGRGTTCVVAQAAVSHDRASVPTIAARRDTRRGGRLGEAVIVLSYRRMRLASAGALTARVHCLYGVAVLTLRE